MIINVRKQLYIFTPPPYKQDVKRSNFKVKFTRFKIIVFLILDWLPYQG